MVYLLLPAEIAGVCLAPQRSQLIHQRKHRATTIRTVLRRAAASDARNTLANR
jgi:hypothetical protein